MNTAIYYPHLYPPPKWLRVAALCWDSVYTVQASDSPPFPRDVAELNSALGGFLETVPFDRAIQDRHVIDEFSAWVEEHADRFRGQQLAEESSGRLQRDLFYLYPGKMGGLDSHIVDRLVTLGLARVESKTVTREMPDWEAERYGLEQPAFFERGSPEAVYMELQEQASSTDNPRKQKKLKDRAEALRQKHLVSKDTWKPLLLVPSELGLHYIALCAGYLAEQDRRDLATGSERFSDVVVSSSRDAVAADVTQALIEAYVPANIEQVEPARLAELRETLRHERHGFQGEVDRLVNEFEEIASEGQMTRLRDDAIDLARTRAEATRRAHHAANLEIAVETLSVSLAPPALLVTTASLLGTGLFAPLGVATALAVGTAKAYLAWRTRGHTRRKAEWSYVFEVRRALGS
jgi:hypothetical protein